MKFGWMSLALLCCVSVANVALAETVKPCTTSSAKSECIVGPVTLNPLMSESKPEREAFDLLVRAERFEDVAIGFAGTMSENVKALRVLDQSPQRGVWFAQLTAKGSLVGRLYGLIGLYAVDPLAYQAALKRLEGSREQKVSGQFGCMVSMFTVGELLENRSPNAVRLAKGESFNQWMSKHKSGSRDVVGGSYTSSFLYDGQR